MNAISFWKHVQEIWLHEFLEDQPLPHQEHNIDEIN